METPITGLGVDEPFRTLVEHAAEGVLLGAPDGRVFYANPAACRMFDCTLERFRRLGRSGVRNPDDPLWQERLDERRRTGTTRGIVRTFRLDGTPLIVEVSSTGFVGSDGEDRTCTVLRDVTERVRMERRLEAYDQVSEALLAGTALTDVLAMVARHALVIFDAACAAISTPAPDGRGVVVTAAHGPAVSDTVAMAFPEGGLSEEVMASGQRILTQDFTALARPDLRELNVGSVMVVPIVSQNDPLGALIVTPPVGHPGYTSDDLDQAVSYAAKAGVVLALGLTRAEAERQLRLNSERLQEALNTRIVIEQAKGLLAGIHGITADEAFDRLRTYARSHGTNIHVIAQRVMNRGLML